MKRKAFKKPTADELRAMAGAFAESLVNRARLSPQGVATLLRQAAAEVEKPKRTFDVNFERDLFADTFTDGGGLVRQCDFCGRTYFATWTETDYDDDEEGGKSELKELRALAAEPKNKYVEWADVDAISGGLLDGKFFVYGCECNAVRVYEIFIWNHRYSIADYLKKRAENERAGAEMIERIAADAATVKESA